MSEELNEKKQISWRSFPLSEDFPKSLILVFIFLLVVFAVHYRYRDIMLTLLAFLILFVSLNRYFIPVQYTINERGFTIKNLFMTERKEWSDFKRIEISGDFLFVSPFEKKCFLDYYRGKVIKFSGNGEEIKKFLTDVGVYKKKCV